MFAKIDAILINSVEKLAQKMQQLTGKTNFFFARVFVGISLILYFIDMINGDMEKYAILIIIGLILFFLFPLRLVEKIAFSQLEFGLANELKINRLAILSRSFMLLANLSFLALDFFSKKRNVFGINYTFYVFAIYLESCDPLPPCRSKIVERIKEFFASKKLTEAKAN